MAPAGLGILMIMLEMLDLTRMDMTCGLLAKEARL
jgi:hypothetical protein